MINEQVIKEITYNYVISLKNQYNIQTLANYNYLRKYKKKEILDILNLDVESFCSKFDSSITRDYVYKNDFFTPRNMVLIHPLYYLYYNYLVFLIAYDYLKVEEISFSKEKMSIFYSGKLIITDNYNEIKNNARYLSSYSDYQETRQSYSNYPAINIDLKDFFNSIKIDCLLDKLYKRGIKTNLVNSLKYFFNHCKFYQLPQIHYSLGSSILSQFYLLDFDEKISNLLITENIHLIRYVDDMTLIILDGNSNIKKMNSIINEISSYLWIDNLALNSAKTKILTPEEYKKSIMLATTKYEHHHVFKSEKIIDEKALDIIKNRKLVELIQDLCEIEKEKGVDLTEYNSLIQKKISINGGEVGKILNNILFSEKLNMIKVDDMYEC